MEAAPPAGSEARRFGKYTLVAKLATGGMAEIFLARLHGDGGFEKLVCIKRILPHLARDPQFVAMFLDEARVAARISHPNVCQVFELGEWNKHYYIAMEYLEGVPLSVFRRKDFYPAPPDPRLVAGFGVQACEGLHHAHQLRRTDGELLGVVHRDITPQNLFATTDGVVKVLDFGIAKVQDATVRTSTGAVKGTYAYMAPEQLRNEKLDRRVDVWAIGVVLWETLAQTHLFKRDTEFLTFEAITKLPIPNICDVRPDVPPLLGDVISRALSRNPDDRFPSARGLGEALGQAVGPLGGPMTPAGISDEVGASFEAALAEQRTLLRMAREGGQFDLESSSPLVGHGTRMTTTPVSSIQRRAAEAQEEVAQYVAASQAIESLFDEDSTSDGRPAQRFGTDGAFTPAPSRAASRRTSGQQAIAPVVDSPSEPRRRSRPMAAEVIHPPAPHRTSKLPWVIALFSVAAAATTGVMLYTKLSEKKAASPDVVANDPPPAPPVQMPVAVTPDAAVAVVAPVAEVDAGVPEPIIEKVEKIEKIDPEPVRRPEKKKKRTEPKPEPKSDARVVETKAAAAPGTITIDSSPVYAVIYIDGKKYGETPLVNIKLPPGKHAVRAVSPSGATKTLSITIESGKTAPVRRISW